MKHEWVNLNSKWINIGLNSDFQIKEEQNHITEDLFYKILYSCSPYDRDVHYETIGPVFSSLYAAEEFLSKLLKGEIDD